MQHSHKVKPVLKMLLKICLNLVFIYLHFLLYSDNFMFNNKAEKKII